MDENLDKLLLEKREDALNYGENINFDNYTASNELTVTITLNEYRSLVISKARHAEAINKLEGETNRERSKRYDAEKERDKLKEELNEAIRTLNSYYQRFGRLEDDYPVPVDVDSVDEDTSEL